MPREKPDFFKTFSVWVLIVPPLCTAILSVMMFQSQAINAAVHTAVTIATSPPESRDPSQIGSALPAFMILGRLVAGPLGLISVFLAPLLARFLAGYSSRVLTPLLVIFYFGALMALLCAYAPAAVPAATTR